jgi:hypothetical protein
MRSLSAGLAGSLSRKARACAIDAYGWSAENMIRSTPTRKSLTHVPDHELEVRVPVERPANDEP